MARACDEVVELTGETALLTAFARLAFQSSLDVEMTDHVGDKERRGRA